MLLFKPCPNTPFYHFWTFKLARILNKLYREALQGIHAFGFNKRWHLKEPLPLCWKKWEAEGEIKQVRITCDEMMLPVSESVWLMSYTINTAAPLTRSFCLIKWMHPSFSVKHAHTLTHTLTSCPFKGLKFDGFNVVDEIWHLLRGVRLAAGGTLQEADTTNP